MCVPGYHIPLEYRPSSRLQTQSKMQQKNIIPPRASIVASTCRVTATIFVPADSSTWRYTSQYATAAANTRLLEKTLKKFGAIIVGLPTYRLKHTQGLSPKNWATLN